MKLKLMLFIFLFLGTVAIGQIEDAPKPEMIIETINPDGSIVISINGRRYRALTEGQMKNVYQMQLERNAYRNELGECENKLAGRNEAE
jgi:hypothetical protein